MIRVPYSTESLSLDSEKQTTFFGKETVFSAGLGVASQIPIEFHYLDL